MSVAVAGEPMATAVTLEVDALAHDYGARRGLMPVSFAIAAPGAVAVTGPNGAGKSTLLRILAGLLRPSHGRARLAHDGRALEGRARRRRVGYAAPDVALYAELTARENLAFAGEALGLADPGRAAAAALERVGLAARADDRAAALSSGMAQRLRLAFAVLQRPAVLLLDEPGSHLDDDGRALLARLIDEHRRDGIVLIATNDEREWRLAGERIELRGGPGHPA